MSDNVFALVRYRAKVPIDSSLEMVRNHLMCSPVGSDLLDAPLKVVEEVTVDGALLIAERRAGLLA